MDKSTRSTGDVSTLGRGISIKGRIAGDGDLTIEGLVEGEIEVDGELRIAEQAEVRAKAHAGSAIIEGLFEGDIVASGPVKAGPGATVRGTVTASTFAMEEGATASVTLAADFELPAELSKNSR